MLTDNNTTKKQDRFQYLTDEEKSFEMVMRAH